MKTINKILVFFTFILVLVISNPLQAQAASGRIFFTDLTVAAGDEFTIEVKVVTYDDSIDTIHIDLKYDSTKIEYLSGESSTKGDNQIIIEATASSKTNIYKLNFRALKNCDTSITVNSSTIQTSSGTEFTIQEGNSAIAIVGGTEVEASTTTDSEFDESGIEVAGLSYVLSEDYIDSEIPLNYTKTSMQIRGQAIQVVLGDTSDIVLVYLELLGQTVVESEVGYTEKGRFFRYDEDTDKFAPYVQITVSDSTYIVFLTEDYEVELPEEYIPTTMTADGFDFIVWQDTELDGYYIIYAINSNGEKGLYRYDVKDQSYQRFELPEEPVNPNEMPNETLQQLVDLIAENLLIMLLINVLFMFLLLVLVVTFGIKLRNRNREIDDIYESGIDNYSSNMQSDNKKDTKPKKEDIFESIGEKEITLDEDMLDDGMTQAFNIDMNADIFSNDGFFNYEDQSVNDTEEAYLRDDIEEDFYDDFEEDSYYDQSVNRGTVGDYAKMQASDDDDIEFIEL